MNITIRDLLKVCEDNPEIEVDFMIEDVGSWRGVYAEACLFIRRNSIITKLNNFVPYLKKLIDGTVYEGWKGGEYIYDMDTPVWVEMDPSSYSGVNSLWVDIFVKNPDFYYALKEITNVK